MRGKKFNRSLVKANIAFSLQKRVICKVTMSCDYDLTSEEQVILLKKMSVLLDEILNNY